MSITLTILRPFTEEKKTVDWVSLECVGGSFVVSDGHRPLINVLIGEGTILYRQSGQELEITVPLEGGLVHVVNNQVILFLHTAV
jgi:F0F1-type ATP synthase epsilon subunit